MPFSLIQVEVDRCGHEGPQSVIGADFACRDDALDRAGQLARSEEKYGYNDDRGYWWFHRDERLFRLVVEDSPPVTATARDPLDTWAAMGFSGLAASVLPQPGRTGVLVKLKEFALKTRRA